jgi:enterochelin esterase-like enzyme
LPVGYNAQPEPLPVLYIFGGPEVQTQANLPNILNNLIGNGTNPFIAVFLKEIKTGPQPLEEPAAEIKAITEIVSKEIVPWMDQKYKTISTSSGRAVLGAAGDGNTALYLAFGYPELFGAVATHSAFLQDNVLNPLRAMITTPDKQPLRIYMDWGLYDYRSTTEGWDNGAENAKFFGFLREKGFRPAGGEVHEGAGWPNWRNRADRVLAALFL